MSHANVVADEEFLAHLANPEKMRLTSRSIKLRHNRKHPRREILSRL